MFELFVGDVGTYLADIASRHQESAYLIDLSNHESKHIGTAFTSLGDLVTVENLHNLCVKADIIYYTPPNIWSDQDNNFSSQKDQTESVVLFCAQTQQVIGHEKIINKWAFINKLDCLRPRVSANKQLWAVGCSISHGVGINKDQAWPHLVSQYLNLPITCITEPGSSILWASDQICRHDINPGDVVLWGLTSQNRLTVIDRHNRLEHLNPGSYEKNPLLLRDLPLSLLDNSSLIYHNVMAVRRAVNFCAKVGAKLVGIGLTLDPDRVYTVYNTSAIRQYLWDPTRYIDFGTDGLHPGPQQHQEFARAFLHELNI